MDAWISEFRHLLLLDEGVQPESIAHALRRPNWIDYRDIELASKITKADLLYLTRWEIDEIIAADISDDQALELSNNCKRRCTKIAELYPEIIRLFKKKTNFSLRYTAERLHDIAHDFSLPIVDRRRPDRVLRDKLRQTSKTKSVLEGALQALVGMRDTLPEFHREFHALNWTNALPTNAEVSEPTDFPGITFENFERQLIIAITALDIVNFDLSSDVPRELQRDYRMGKQDVVALAYDFYVSCGGPPLVTTPGSEFSYLCSLIYEVATGQPGEGLAGAIIDFSRSRHRHEEDRYQEEVERDEEAYAGGDNFHHQKAGAESDRTAAQWYLDAARRFEGTHTTSEALGRVANEFLARAASRESQFGPFIVWADHIPQSRNEAWEAEAKIREEELRELRIRVGELKRRVRRLS